MRSTEPDGTEERRLVARVELPRYLVEQARERGGRAEREYEEPAASSEAFLARGRLGSLCDSRS